MEVWETHHVTMPYILSDNLANPIMMASQPARPFQCTPPQKCPDDQGLLTIGFP